MCSHNCLAPLKVPTGNCRHCVAYCMQLLGHVWAIHILFASPSAFSASQAAAHAL